MYKLVKTDLIVVFIGIFVILPGCTVYYNGKSFNYHADKQVSVSASAEPGETIFTEVTHTDLTVAGLDTNTCAVTADLTVHATSQEIADAVITELDVQLIQQNGRLEIVVMKPELHKEDYSVSGKMNITMPSTCAVDMKTTHGECRINDIQQAVAIRSTHGNMDLGHISGNIEAGTTHGNVSVRDSANGQTKVNTTHGKISLERCKCERVECGTTHDPVYLSEVDAETVKLNTTHDWIQLAQCSGRDVHLQATHGAITGDIQGIERLNASTTHAPIRLACVNEVQPEIAATLGTTHASIEFCPPPAFAGRVDFSTTHGKIETDRPVLVQGALDKDHYGGTIGQGSGSITLRSTHGDLKLK